MSEESNQIQPLTITLDYLELPLRCTYAGGNRSPSIRISNLNSESLAVMVFNPFIKSCCSFTPWIIWNIPPVTRIPEGIPPGSNVTSPIAAVQGINDYGEVGYHGPEPPAGEIQRYQFRVYGLDSMLDLPGGKTKDDLLSVLREHTIQYGETVAICR
jgi:hypothetical protein